MQNPLIYEIRSSHLLNSPLTSCNTVKFNDMPSPRKMKALTLWILRSAALLQLRLLDTDHVSRLLLTPCSTCNFNLTLANMRACRAQPKLLLNIKNVARLCTACPHNYSLG